MLYLQHFFPMFFKLALPVSRSNTYMYNTRREAERRMTDGDSLYTHTPFSPPANTILVILPYTHYGSLSVEPLLYYVLIIRFRENT